MLYSIGSVTSILNESNTKILSEADTPEKGLPLMVVQAPLGQCDVKGANGFIYPCPVFKKAVEEHLRPLIQEGIAYGELDHPDLSSCPEKGSSFCDKRQVDVKLERVSHRILDAWWEGNTLIGKLHILPTPHGQIVYNLLKVAKAPVGVSLRAIGSVRNVNGENVVVSMYLKTFDIVAIPSYRIALVKPLQESATELISKYNKTKCIGEQECYVNLSEDNNIIANKKLLELMLAENITHKLQYIFETLF